MENKTMKRNLDKIINEHVKLYNYKREDFVNIDTFLISELLKYFYLIEGVSLDNEIYYRLLRLYSAVTLFINEKRIYEKYSLLDERPLLTVSDIFEKLPEQAGLPPFEGEKWKDYETFANEVDEIKERLYSCSIRSLIQEAINE